MKIIIETEGISKKHARMKLKQALKQVDIDKKHEKHRIKSRAEYLSRCTCRGSKGLCQACCEFPSTITGIYPR